jgi:uncharacterized protein YkwD
LSFATRSPARLAASTAVLAIAALMATVATQASAAELVAPRSECKAQTNIKAPEREQEQAMRCLINYARSHAGAGALGSSKSLERAAGQKSGDVMQCGFSHTACGRPADLYARRYGYASASSWAWGENLAVGRGKRGSARKVLKAWLQSPPHRDAMLRGSFDDAGVGLKRGRFGGHRNMAVWVLELGCHGCG